VHVVLSDLYDYAGDYVLTYCLALRGAVIGGHHYFTANVVGFRVHLIPLRFVVETESSVLIRLLVNPFVPLFASDIFTD